MSIEDRFWSKVEKTDYCWEWISTLNAGGYGVMRIDGRYNELAHRLSYKLNVGEVAVGLDLDHLCRNRKCVNPNHLEAVDRRTNLLRGKGRTARNANATHCPRGHEYDQENTYVRKSGSRQCRACNRITTNKWHKKNEEYLNTYWNIWNHARIAKKANVKL